MALEGKDLPRGRGVAVDDVVRVEVLEAHDDVWGSPTADRTSECGCAPSPCQPPDPGPDKEYTPPPAGEGQVFT